MKKNLPQISSFYSCVPKITIIWCTVPEKRNETDRIFCHFGPFFALLAPFMIPKIKILKQWKTFLEILSFVYQKWTSYDILFLKYKAKQTNFFGILGHFLLFLPPDSLENQNFKKLKNIPGGTIILHMCTINDNHIMYGSWDMECDG